MKKSALLMIAATMGYFLPVLNIHSQTKYADSVLKTLYKATSTSNKVAEVQKIAATLEVLHATEIPTILNKINKEISYENNVELDAIAATMQLRYYLLIGKLDSAEASITDTKNKIAVAQATPKTQLLYHYNINRLLLKQGNFKGAIAGMLKNVSEAEALKDYDLMCRINNGIGLSYMLMEQCSEAIIWFTKARVISETIMPYPYISIIYNNIASCFNNNQQYDSAMVYVNKGMAKAAEKKLISDLANSYNIKADILLQLKKSNEAEALLLKALELRQLDGDVDLVASDLAQLAMFYASVGKYEKGIAAARNALDTISKYKIESKLLFAYQALATNYKQKSDMANYAQTMEKIVQIKDEVYTKNSATELEKLKAAYEIEKKENIISKQQLALTNKNWIMYGGSLLLVLLVLTFILLIQSLKRRQKAKILQTVFEERLQAEKSVAVAEDKQRKRIAADLHDNLGVQANAIMHNAGQLQNTDTNVKAISTNLQQMAKEMMVNLRDTLWAMNSGNIAAIDLWLRAKNFCQQMNRQFGNVKIKSLGEAPEFIFKSNIALNILMIVQEAINNSLKHSRCDEIILRSNCHQNFWEIEIMDNGKGFDVNQTATNGYGIANIKQRSAAGAFDVSINAIPNEGTTIFLKIPLHNFDGYDAATK